MSADTSTSTHGVLNGLSDHYARILGPKYSDLYRKHIGEVALGLLTQALADRSLHHSGTPSGA